MLTRRNEQGAQQVAANGGMMDEAGEVVNGTEVPAGSLDKEVADDVPAMLSEGEFVVPADVVRYIGLEKLMKMRDAAKEGLERMEEVGQMGNADEVSDSDQPFDQDDDAFESEIDSILAEDGAAMQTEQMFAAGGYVSGDDVTKATRNPAVDVRYFKHKDGRVMYITYINDKPMTAIPDGFDEVSAEVARKGGREVEKKEEKEEKEETKSSETGSGSGGDMGLTQQEINPYAKEGVKGEFGINESGLPVSTSPDDPLYMARQKSDTSDILAKVLPPLTLALGPLGLLLKPIVKKYLTGEAKKAQDEELGLIGTQLSPFQQQGKVGELGDYKSVTSMVDQFGQNTGVMNGYFLAATDSFTSKVFNDIVEKSGAQDLTPAQVGVIGLAIDNAVKDKLASNPNMTLEEAQRATAKEFVPESVDQAKIDAERQAQIIDEARLAEQARQEDVARAEAAARAKAEAAARAKAEADAKAKQQAKQAAQYTPAQNQAREVASTPSSWSPEQRQQAESSGMVNVGGVTVSNDATIRAQNEALFGPGTTGRDSYSDSIAETYGTTPGSEQTNALAAQEGGWFAKGGFVRPRKKSKKK